MEVQSTNSAPRTANIQLQEEEKTCCCFDYTDSCLRTYVLLVVGSVVSIADIVTDVLLFIKWLQLRLYAWAIGGLAIVAFSNILCACMITRDIGCQWAPLILVGATPLVVLCKFMKGGCCGRSFLHETYLNFLKTEVKIYELFESVPSGTLQMFIVVGKTTQIDSIVGPFQEGAHIAFLDGLSLALSFVMMCRHCSTILFDLQKTNGRKMEIWQIVLFYVWVLCEIAHRVLSVVLGWYTLGVFRFVAIPVLVFLYMIVGCYYEFLQIFRDSQYTITNLLGVLAPSGLEMIAVFFSGNDAEYHTEDVRDKRVPMIILFGRTVGDILLFFYANTLVNTWPPYVIPSQGKNMFEMWRMIGIVTACVSGPVTVGVFGYNWYHFGEDDAKAVEMNQF